MSSVLDAVDVTPDLSSGHWQVRFGGFEHTVRPWTWGERRRLLAASLRPGPRLDRDAFLEGLVGLLSDPPPEAAGRAVIAAVALRLCGVEPGQRVAPLLDAEAWLAQTWRWGPAELDHQPAPRIDEQLRDLAAPAPTDGWNRIEVHDDD